MSWLTDLPLFYELTGVDLLVLLVLGVAWSGCVWMIVEGIKERLAVPKPYPRRFRVVLSWLPILASAAGAALVFPGVLEGVGQPPGESAAALGFAVGIVGGFGAKLGHELAYGFLRAIFDGLSAVVRKGGK